MPSLKSTFPQVNNPLPSSKPPATNRGAQNTQAPPPQNAFGVDWVEVTLPLGYPWRDLPAWFDLPAAEWVKLPKGAQGYKCHFQAHGISVLTEGTPEMGVHLVFKAECIRGIGPGTDWGIFFRHVFSWGGHVSRLDLAIDEVTRAIDLDRVLLAVKAGNCVSRFKQWQEIVGGDFKGETKGRTIYFGSSKSRCMFRFYDKGLEQGSAPAGDWLRIEGQLRDDNAQNMGRLMADYDEEKRRSASAIVEVLGNYISFRTPDNKDTNKTRWRVASWWADFLGTASKLSISTAKPVRSLAAKAKWFKRQMGVVLAQVGLAFGPENLAEVMKEGLGRMNKTHWAQVKETGYQTERGYSWAYII